MRGFLYFLSLLFIAMVGTDHHFVVLAADGRAPGGADWQTRHTAGAAIQSDALPRKSVQAKINM